MAAATSAAHDRSDQPPKTITRQHPQSRMKQGLQRIRATRNPESLRD
jgi:hypothetical protein